jgi:uncharacterized protein YcnI
MTSSPRTAPTGRRLRRRAARLALGLAAGGAAVVALPTAASAHVTLQPGTVEGGGFAVVSFRVPNERDDASTTKVRVVLPTDHPLGSVQTTPVPGWRVNTEQRTLDEPIELFGSPVDRVVSQVTWTATGVGLGPGQFQDFELSLGRLPESGRLVFDTQQTYAGGERVDWDEVAVGGGAEPEHPAPVLTLSAPPGAEAAATGAEAGSALPVGLSVAALLVSLAALVVAARRARR